LPLASSASSGFCLIAHQTIPKSAKIGSFSTTIMKMNIHVFTVGRYYPQQPRRARVLARDRSSLRQR